MIGYTPVGRICRRGNYHHEQRDDEKHPFHDGNSPNYRISYPTKDIDQNISLIVFDNYHVKMKFLRTNRKHQIHNHERTLM